MKAHLDVVELGREGHVIQCDLLPRQVGSARLLKEPAHWKREEG